MIITEKEIPSSTYRARELRKQFRDMEVGKTIEITKEEYGKMYKSPISVILHNLKRDMGTDSHYWTDEDTIYIKK